MNETEKMNVWTALAPYQAVIVERLEKTLRVGAIDNRGVLTSPRRAPQVAGQIGNLFFDFLQNTAGQPEIKQLIAPLVDQGLVYSTVQNTMQTCRQAALELAGEDPSFQLKVLLAVNDFSDWLLRETAASRELLMTREQEQYQASAQRTLYERLERVQTLTGQLEQRQKNLQAVLNIYSVISSLADESELLSRFVELVPAVLPMAGVAVLELDEGIQLHITRAAAGRFPRKLDKSRARPVKNWPALEQAVTQNQFLVTPLPDGDETLKSEVIVPLGMVQSTRVALVLWSSEAHLAVDELDYLRPLTIMFFVTWQNFRLLVQAEKHARDLEVLYGQRLHQIWRTTARSTSQVYVYDEVGMREEKAGADDTGQALNIPLVLRERPIGQLSLPQADGETWPAEDIAFAESVLADLAYALENAALIHDTQRTARHEQTIRQITEKMRAATSLEQLAQVTARELGERLSAGHALVELGIESEPKPELSQK